MDVEAIARRASGIYDAGDRAVVAVDQLRARRAQAVSR